MCTVLWGSRLKTIVSVDKGLGQSETGRQKTWVGGVEVGGVSMESGNRVER